MAALWKLLGACTFNHADEALARWLLMVPDFLTCFNCMLVMHNLNCFGKGYWLVLNIFPLSESGASSPGQDGLQESS